MKKGGSKKEAESGEAREASADAESGSFQINGLSDDGGLGGLGLAGPTRVRTGENDPLAVTLVEFLGREGRRLRLGDIQGRTESETERQDRKEEETKP